MTIWNSALNLKCARSTKGKSPAADVGNEGSTPSHKKQGSVRSYFLISNLFKKLLSLLILCFI